MGVVQDEEQGFERETSSTQDRGGPGGGLSVFAFECI